MIVPLDSDQKACVKSVNGTIVIIAGPGSGKTTVLTNRYYEMVSLHSIKAEDILNLTFTREAAENMVRRVGLSGSDETFRTFHSFVLELIRRERDNMPFELTEEVLPCGKDVDLYKRLLKLYPAIKSYNVLKDKIAQWKAGNVSPDQAVEDAEGTDLWLAYAYKDYEKKCREEGWLDFSSMMDEAVKLLESNDEVRRRYQRKYIAVDECQDTDVVQFRLLQLLFNGNIFVVGDENQLIYEWRSAVAGNLTNFATHFPGASTLYLGNNYRSTGAIVEFLKLILPVDNGLASHMRSMREYGVDPTYVKYDTENHEAEAILDKVLAINDLSNTAIICRTNRQLRTIQKAALRRTIKSNIVGQKNLWQRDEVKDLLKQTLNNMDMTVPADVLLKRVFETKGLDRKYANTGQANEKPPVENMLDFIKLSANRGNIVEFSKWLNKLTHAYGGKEKHPTLSLTTVHQAKGREWKYVYVAGAEQGMMPHKDGEIMEEKRIFFVACSRAADRLEISYAGNRSEFLNQFQEKITQG